MQSLSANSVSESAPKKEEIGAGQVGTPGSELRVTGLRKTFLSPNGEQIKVLRDVSFTAVAGEIIAVMGASGAGKSTLLNLLGDLEAADAGSIFFGETGLGQAPDWRASQVSFVFQFHYLLQDLTAVENVALPLLIARMKRHESIARARRALENIGLEERLEHRIGFLSGGEQQRVAVVRALITRPKLILADEPTGNLDALIAEEIGSSLISYCRHHHAIAIVATHNERLAQLCDRTLLLEHGNIRVLS